MERNKYLDSAKFILIFLVVLAHTSEYDLFNDKIKLLVYIFSSTFTIPLFIIISGYFSQNLTWEKYKKFFLGFFLVYLLFQIIYSIPAIFTGNINWVNFIFLPIGPLWYLAGLLFWRFLIIIIKKFNISSVVSILFSMIVSLAISFIPFNPLKHPEYASAIRAIVFIPHFLVGYYSPKDSPQRIKNINKVYPIMFFLFLAIFVYFFGTAYQAFTTFGGYPYAAFESIAQGVIQRVIFLSFAVVSSIAFFSLIPGNFYKLGSYSLSILLLHILFVYPVYRVILSKNNVVMPFYIDLLVAVLITFICVLLSKIKIIQLIMNPLLLISKVYGSVQRSK